MKNSKFFFMKDSYQTREIFILLENKGSNIFNFYSLKSFVLFSTNFGFENNNCDIFVL